MFLNSLHSIHSFTIWLNHTTFDRTRLRRILWQILCASRIVYVLVDCHFTCLTIKWRTVFCLNSITSFDETALLTSISFRALELHVLFFLFGMLFLLLHTTFLDRGLSTSDIVLELLIDEAVLIVVLVFFLEMLKLAQILLEIIWSGSF